MEIKVIAKSYIGKEYIYDYTTAHKVSKSSAEKIVSALNRVSWRLNKGETWHVYDVADYEEAYYYAERQKFTIRKGIIKAYSL